MQPSDTVPLIEITRGKIVETIHRGAIVVIDRWGNLQYVAGNPQLKTYMRSAAKPFQLLPTLEAGATEILNLKQTEISVMCASHSSEDYHIKTIRGILRRIGLTEDMLQCRPNLLRHEEELGTIHSVCSGEHTGMLTLCRIKGFPIVNYPHPLHPVQQLILQKISELAKMETNEIVIATDSCGAPTFALPIAKFALLFSRLADPALLALEQRNALNQIRVAMMKHPEYMSGSGQFCAAMMSQFPGEIVLKSGAGGTYGIGLPKHGLGIALKLENNRSEPQYAAILATLKQLELLPTEGLDRLQFQFCPPVRNYRNEIVGEIRSVFS